MKQMLKAIEDDKLTYNSVTDDAPEFVEWQKKYLIENKELLQELKRRKAEEKRKTEQHYYEECLREEEEEEWERNERIKGVSRYDEEYVMEMIENGNGDMIGF